MLALLVAITVEGPHLREQFPHEAVRILTEAKEIELLSLYPSNYLVLDKVNGDDRRANLPRFYRQGILGVTKLAKAEVRKQVLSELTKAIGSQSIAERGLCFIPRHGFRATVNKTTVELVVCFECSNLAVYINGELKSTHAVKKAPEVLLNKILTDAKIPLPEAVADESHSEPK